MKVAVLTKIKTQLGCHKMTLSSSELAGVIGRCQAGVTSALRQVVGREDRAARLADLLLELIPDAAWTACVLSGEEPGTLAIRPENGSISPERKERLREQLASLDPLLSEIQELPSAPEESVRTRAVAIHEDDRPRGFLAIGLSGAAPPGTVARAEVLLAVCAPAVAVRWEWESVRGEQAELAKFALLGQAFVGLAHELNNALNSMMLQTSVVQLRVDAQARNDLAAIRQHGVQAAALVRSLQHVAQERRGKVYSVDLNGVLTDVLEETPTLRRRVSVQLGAEVPRIQSTRSALKQLVRLLLAGLLAGTKSAVRVRTEKREDGVVLNMELPETPGESGSTPDAILWQHLDEVGRHAGQSLLRQLGGNLLLDWGSDKRWVIRVVWETSAREASVDGK
jgi:signal transduction histidine kinase